ncbi:hypothetical protein Krac_9270 [Ktedonobacter racemifer DSM 44963]|uniref:Uncharacterized protein n=1 Tax=Ktedonobacter racemifer DSM 44963 TaxID=485913 RepID=D6TBD2_KTERA|nr:hypothetical protein Krac_9270 [Ktedonobacter racemifer DSM 44963]
MLGLAHSEMSSENIWLSGNRTFIRRSTTLSVILPEFVVAHWWEYFL